MKIVNSYGGHSIGVYNAENMDKAKVYKMILLHSDVFYQYLYL